MDIENNGININEEIFYGGCKDGINRINCDSEGNITPCALMRNIILNISDLSKEEAQLKYCTHNDIKMLFLRDLKGHCKDCKLKWHCGGCRAIPYNLNGDILGEDPTCFINGRMI